jgi:hypothetical protein
MRGELLPVWQDTWREIWEPLSLPVENEEGFVIYDPPQDLFCPLFEAFYETAYSEALDTNRLAEIINSPDLACSFFKSMTPFEIKSEADLLAFMERAFAVLTDMENECRLSETYFNLTKAFFEKFSLRYDLVKPYKLTITLSGLFTSLHKELKLEPIL